MYRLAVSLLRKPKSESSGDPINCNQSAYRIRIHPIAIMINQGLLSVHHII